MCEWQINVCLFQDGAISRERSTKAEGGRRDSQSFTREGPVAAERDSYGAGETKNERDTNEGKL